MRSRKALVTGCCGFIGGHLTRMLVKQGWDVVGVDDLSNGDPSVLHDIDVRCVPPTLLPAYNEVEDSEKTLIITGDFADEHILMRIAESEFDVIFHLAANPRVEYSVKNPASTTHINVQKTVELMTASIGKIDRFVFASSSASYGNVTELPTTESTPTNPESPYGLQKLIVEQFGELFNKLYGLDFVALRFFNVYGPGQIGNSPYSTAVAAWCTRISENKPLRSDGDGEQKRDMVYVEDVANAMIMTANHQKNLGYVMYNIATGDSVTNNEILSSLKDRFGDRAIVNHAPERAGDVKYTLGSIEKITKEVGWVPLVEFWAGLDMTLRWWGLIDE